MALRLAPELITRLVRGPDEDVPLSELLLNDVPTGKIVEGAYLEAAVAWQNGFLLLLTHDCPFEEGVSIHLLDRDLSMLDSASIGLMYGTGMFSSLELREPNEVRFHFFGDDAYCIVELLPQPGFRIPLISEPHWVWRRFSFSRHFIVREAVAEWPAGSSSS